LQSLTVALVLSRLDYGSTVLAGLPKQLLDRIKPWQIPVVTWNQPLGSGLLFGHPSRMQQRLRSALSSDLMVPWTIRSTIGERFFQSAAASTRMLLLTGKICLVLSFFRTSVTVQKSTQDT